VKGKNRRTKVSFPVLRCSYKIVSVTTSEVRIGVGGKTDIRSVDGVPEKETCYLETLERN